MKTCNGCSLPYEKCCGSSNSYYYFGDLPITREPPSGWYTTGPRTILYGSALEGSLEEPAAVPLDPDGVRKALLELRRTLALLGIDQAELRKRVALLERRLLRKGGPGVLRK